MEAEKLPTPIKFEKWCAWNAAPCEKSAEAQIERLQEKIQELEATLSAVGAGGVSAQRITQADALDAERYRWLRDPAIDPGLVIDKVVGETPLDEFGCGGYKRYEYRAGEELDDAIDAAIAAAKENK